MKKVRLQKNKVWILLGIIILYIIIAGTLLSAVSMGIIQKSLPTVLEIVTIDTVPDVASKSILPELQSAQIFFDKNFLKSNGHILLYITQYPNMTDKDTIDKNSLIGTNVSSGFNSSEINGNNSNLEDINTNSEAVSYYMLWKAQSKDKESFDNEIEFVKKNMIQPKYGYMMWRLNSSEKAEGDGSNIATDADLRTIKALLIAEKQWKDENDTQKYTQLIDEIASGIEKVGVTKDGYLAPYGGMSSENSTWTADEVWLSYSDFTVFRELAARRGQPWTNIYGKMKDAALKSQLENGLYNSMLTKERTYGNGIDGGGYSINSMWIMIRNAESKDVQLMQSAKISLNFYKEKFNMDNELYAQYDSNSNPLNPTDNPWVYALVGRAAIALDDKDFSESMIRKLIEHQITDNESSIYGSFPEGSTDKTRIGQFTMQESILTMQDFEEKNR